MVDDNTLAQMVRENAPNSARCMRILAAILTLQVECDTAKDQVNTPRLKFSLGSVVRQLDQIWEDVLEAASQDASHQVVPFPANANV